MVNNIDAGFKNLSSVGLPKPNFCRRHMPMDEKCLCEHTHTKAEV